MELFAILAAVIIFVIWGEPILHALGAILIFALNLSFYVIVTAMSIGFTVWIGLMVIRFVGGQL